MAGTDASAACQMRQVPSKELDSRASGRAGQNSTKDTTLVCPTSTALDSPISPACNTAHRACQCAWLCAFGMGVILRCTASGGHCYSIYLQAPGSNGPVVGGGCKQGIVRADAEVSDLCRVSAA
jgi:hypothetical protein